MFPASACGIAELRPIWPRYPACAPCMKKLWRAIDLADRVEHRERGLVRGALRDLGLGDARARVALEEAVREVPPAHALADQRDLGLGLDRHLLLDLLDHANDSRPGELGECRAAVAEDPRVAVLVGADLPGEAERGEGLLDRLLRPGIALDTRGSARRGRTSPSPRRARPRAAGRRARASRLPRARTRSAARWERTRTLRSRGRSTGSKSTTPESSSVSEALEQARRSVRGAPRG